MHKNNIVRQLSMIAVGVMALVSVSLADAVSPLEVPLQIKRSEVTSAAGLAVVINEVTDNRQFNATVVANGSSVESSPNLNDRIFNNRLAGQLLDKEGEPRFLSVTDDQSIGGLIGDSVAEAFRRAGYEVIRKSSPGAADAIKINVDLRRFWVWADPNPESRKSYFFNAEIEAIIQVDVPPFSLPSNVGGNIRARGKRPKKDVSWQRTGNRGIEDFVKNITILLTYPPACATNQQCKSGEQ